MPAPRAERRSRGSGSTGRAIASSNMRANPSESSAAVKPGEAAAAAAAVAAANKGTSIRKESGTPDRWRRSAVTEKGQQCQHQQLENKQQLQLLRREQGLPLADSAGRRVQLSRRASSPSAGKGTRGGNQPQPPRATSTMPTKQAATAAGRARGAHDNAMRNAPQTAPKREYTLFDHLVATGAPPRPSADRAVDRRRPHRGAMVVGEASARRHQQQQPRREGEGFDLGDHVGGGARSTPSPSVLVAGSSAAEGAAVAAVMKGGSRALDGSTVVSFGGGSGTGGGGLGCAKGKGFPRPRAGNNKDTPKPGKQRLGPRRRKLSSLKKRILLDRVERWRQQPASATERPALGESPPPAAVAVDDGHVDGGTVDDTGVGGERWVVVIRNFADEEDVEDDDEHAEVERDLTEMASTFGVVLGVEVPRAARVDLAEDAAKVAFATRDEAKRAREGFNGRVVGGKALEVEIVECGGCETKGCDGKLSALGTPRPCDLLSEGCGGDHRGAHEAERGCPGEPVSSAAVWRVAVKNLVDQDDDLSDEEEYAEVCADAATMMGAYGHLLAIDVPRKLLLLDESGCDAIDRVVATFGSLAEAEACTKGVRGRRVGGKELDAELIGPLAPATPADGVRGRGEVVEMAISSSRATEEGSQRHGTPQAVKDDSRLLMADFGDATDYALTAKATLSQSASGDDVTGGRVGGQRGDVGVGPDGDKEMEVTAAPRRGGDEAAYEWRVVVRNLIDEDDLLGDNDEYDEVCADFAAMAGEFGRVTGYDIPREAGSADGAGMAQRGEAVAFFGSAEEAEACARGLRGRKVAGKSLELEVVEPPPWRGQRTETGDQPSVEGRLGEGKAFLQRSTPLQQGEVSPVLLSAHGARASGPPCRRAVDGQADGGRDSRQATSASASGAVAAVAGIQPAVVAAAAAPMAARFGGVFKAPTAATLEKRVPDKYKEAILLPRPPGASGITPKAVLHQPPDGEVDTLVFEILQVLFKFQERARLLDPVKAKGKRRLVMGLREVLRAVKAKKVRLVIVAPNVDPMGGAGGLDEKVSEIVDTARDGGTPVVFSLSKRKIGKALGKTIKVSVVGVYSFDGANEQHKQLKRHLEVVS